MPGTTGLSAHKTQRGSYQPQRKKTYLSGEEAEGTLAAAGLPSETQLGRVGGKPCAVGKHVSGSSPPAVQSGARPISHSLA